jgi:hypothetical protein
LEASTTLANKNCSFTCWYNASSKILHKKVHGFTQEQMPKIERSVAYTFDAYSGGLKNEALGERKAKFEKFVISMQFYLSIF